MSQVNSNSLVNVNELVEQIVCTLIELCLDSGKADELRALSVRQLMRQHVLKRCLCLPRSGYRYPRISGRFMKLMAKHGKDFLMADYELGSVLLELAMQRISRHPYLPAIDYKGILPDEYKQYSAASINPDGINGCPDEPGLWGYEELLFLKEMLPTCLELQNEAYRNHAVTILFQLLFMFSSRASSLGVCLDEQIMDEEKLRAGFVTMAENAGLIKEMIERCFKADWRRGIDFYMKLSASYTADVLAAVDLLTQEDLDNEIYYIGQGRWFLKFFGIYNQMTKKKIREELTKQLRK